MTNLPHRLEPPVSILVTQGRIDDSNFDIEAPRVIERVRMAVECGVSAVQIRERKLSARRSCDLATAAAAVTKGTATKLLINDRADIAAGCGADGVHLTAASVPAADIRRAFGKEMMIGVSTHSPAEVAAARLNGADYVLFGPVFPSTGKPDPQGLGLLAEAALAGGDLPVLAIGGIDAANVTSVLAAGASGVAAIRAMNDPSQLRELIAELER